jgi:hypothetical protein
MAALVRGNQAITAAGHTLHTFGEHTTCVASSRLPDSTSCSTTTTPKHPDPARFAPPRPGLPLPWVGYPSRAG